MKTLDLTIPCTRGAADHGATSGRCHHRRTSRPDGHRGRLARPDQRPMEPAAAAARLPARHGAGGDRFSLGPPAGCAETGGPRRGGGRADLLAGRGGATGLRTSARRFGRRGPRSERSHPRSSSQISTRARTTTGRSNRVIASISGSSSQRPALTATRLVMGASDVKASASFQRWPLGNPR